MEWEASEKPSPVAFGSGVERRLFPTASAPTRMGIEQGIQGQPHRAPGMYDPDLLSIFLRCLDDRPKSMRGCYFGATSGDRLLKRRKTGGPSPAAYQHLMLWGGKTSGYKPFGAASSRFAEDSRGKGLPGPGSYEHAATLGRHMEFNESFGGRRELRATVTVKCTLGIPDKCRKCEQEPIGDYYENGCCTLCRVCYRDRQLSVQGGELKGFYKVRDCRSIHRHDFPGRSPKVHLSATSQEKRQRQREAYFSLYYC